MKQSEKNQLIEIGERLYKCRKEKKWSQAIVAEKLDVAINTVSSIENGLQQFNVSILLRFAEIYDVSTDYILQGKEYEKKESALVQKINQLPVAEQERMDAVIDAFYGLKFQVNL